MFMNVFPLMLMSYLINQGCKIVKLVNNEQKKILEWVLFTEFYEF